MQLLPLDANARCTRPTTDRLSGLRLGRVGRLVSACTTLILAPSASIAAQQIGAAQSFGVLASTTVTNSGATRLDGDLGLSPGVSITGLGTISQSGTVHAGDAVAQRARSSASAAFAMFAALPPSAMLTGQDLGGLTLLPGVYRFASSAQLTGALTLDFLGNTNAQFVFQIGSTLTTASSSSITVRNGGTGSGIYFQVGSSATLGTGSRFVGNILADQSITLNSAATIVCGRALALNAAVTMDNNIIDNDCGVIGGDFGSYGFSGGPSVTVPEPSTALLLAAGGAMLLAAARVRRHASHHTTADTDRSVNDS